MQTRIDHALFPGLSPNQKLTGKHNPLLDAYLHYSCCLPFLTAKQTSLTAFQKSSVLCAMITLNVLHFRLPEGIYGNGRRILFCHVMLLPIVLLITLVEVIGVGRVMATATLFI